MKPSSDPRGSRTAPDWILLVRELRARLQKSCTALGQYFVAAAARAGPGTPDCKSQQLFPVRSPFWTGDARRAGPDVEFNVGRADAVEKSGST